MPSKVYTPELVGPIEGREPGPGATYFVIVDGQAIQMTEETPRDLTGRADPVDSLFIYGRDNGGEWYMTAGRSDSRPGEPCYVIESSRAFDAGVDIIIGVSDSEGLRLPKAPNYEPASTADPESGQYPASQAVYCLNERGEVFRAEETIRGS